MARTAVTVIAIALALVPGLGAEAQDSRPPPRQCSSATLQLADPVFMDSARSPGAGAVVTVAPGEAVLAGGVVGSWVSAIVLTGDVRYAGDGKAGKDRAGVRAGRYPLSGAFNNHVVYWVDGGELSGPDGERFASGRVWLALNRGKETPYVMWSRKGGYRGARAIEAPRDLYRLEYCQGPLPNYVSEELVLVGAAEGRVILEHRQYAGGRRPESTLFELPATPGRPLTAAGTILVIQSIDGDRVRFRIVRGLGG